MVLDLHQKVVAWGAHLMLRISVLGSTGDALTLLLEGNVIGDAVDAVNSSCDHVLAEGKRLILDLAGVSFIDRRGVALFHRLTARHVEVVKCSGFVAEQLKVRDQG